MERDAAIKQLENFQLELYSEILQNASLHMAANEEFKRYPSYYKDSKVVAEDFKRNVLDRIIHRYRSDGYNHTTTDVLVMEYDVWKFAHANPEQWFMMTEKIHYGYTEVNTYEGFRFMDHFIHNGILDDWELCIAKKDHSVLFVNDSDSDTYKKDGFEVEHLSMKTMNHLLDSFNKPQRKMKM